MSDLDRDDRRDDRDDDRDDDLVARAADALRLHTDEGWVRIRQRVVDAALAAVRPARTVAARHELGGYSLSTDVLTALLREELDALPDAAPRRVVFETDDDDRLTEVRVEVVAVFGSDLLEVAEAVRAVFRPALDAVLGTPLPAVHVHIGDVTADRRRL